MTIGEIKKEALRLLQATEREVDGEAVSDLEGDAFCADYLRRMTGAIGRCLSDMERRLALLPVCRAVAEGEWEHTAHVSRLSLAAWGDVSTVLEVSREGEDGYAGDVAFSVAGQELVLPRLAAGTQVRVTYVPIAPRVERYDNSLSLDAAVPASLQPLIPYFLKGELYREEEPAEASEAHSRYEAGMEEYLRRMTVGGGIGGGQVVSVYSLTET